ncbi:MAG TPA: plasma-membrane proton-efflux P-type ATPase [Fimbriimonadaceae bacterium]|nr:plasma-membrane proton-efflux P-type ATPase [Fimbriimonadaceae bacterium]
MSVKKLAPEPKTIERPTLDGLMKTLEATEDGLSQEESAARLAKYGYNEIAEKKSNPFLKFLGYFWGPIPWMIEVAVVLSAAVRHWEDFFVIFVLLLANAVVGFVEEFQADNAIAALKSRLAVRARVLRGGNWTGLAAREIVPGDVIHVRLGDIVPADALLLHGEPIEVDQSALTGESLPVERNAGDTIYSGSIVRRGEIGALVYGTGANTFFGKTAQLVQQAKTTSHFQRALLKIGDYLILIAAFLIVIIVTVALFRGDPMLSAQPGQEPVLLFALILAVAAIPVAMPTVLSVTMAVGARILARKEAIVSRLAAIEELAGVDVLCSDKTGTLTQNKLALGDPFCVGPVTPEELIAAASLASRAENNDTIDSAILAALGKETTLAGYEVLHFVPFDPVKKRTEATVKGPDGKTFKVAKGAPQVILGLAKDSEDVKKAAEEAVEAFAKRGYRALGVARANGDVAWDLLGILSLFDPPRADAKETIATARQMGLDVKMVTGDAVAIARETAAQLGLGTNILDASTFEEARSYETAKQEESIEAADGFAQVFPEHKFHIVEVLQKRNHIVGMTGDGVNDAPALKKADCGIAVSGATDAARAAAAIILLTPGLSVLVDAIKESRKIFQRMNSYAIYRITETIRVLLFMTLSILVFNFYPVTAMMLVLLALLNDGAILSIAFDRVKYLNKPEAWNLRLVLRISTILGITGVFSSFGLFYLGERIFKLDRDTIQTLMYLKLSVAGHLTIFITRTRGPFWSHRPANALLSAVFGTQILATLIAVYGVFMAPIGWAWAGAVWGYAIIWFLIGDAVKLFAYNVFDPTREPLLGRVPVPSGKPSHGKK